ncbi:MAG: cyclase family protein, partial [Candidatus Eisenbacteria bacterium]|nr:cyclase family protein [Candidatus Eisenbacteria bacterium]
MPRPAPSRRSSRSRPRPTHSVSRRDPPSASWTRRASTMDDRSRLIDLSHVVEHGLVTYRGLPAPSIGTHLSREQSARHYAPGTTFHIGRIDMVANTGTYLDAPYHRYADGWDLADLPLESLADLDGLRIEADSETRAIEDWEARPVRGRAVLFHTGWDRHWG